MAVTAEQPFAGTQRRYWHLAANDRFDGSYEDAKRRLDQLLTRAVEKRLLADVPLGAFLSGGVDSSVVVGLMHKLGASPLRTFSIGFEDPRYDEAPHARAVAKHFGTEHHEHVVTPQARGILETLAYHYDEPFADSSAIPTYYVSQWARESVTVALTGDAGDECFAGYDRYRAVRLAARFDWMPSFLRSAVAAAADLLPHSTPRSASNRAYRFLRALRLSPMQQYLQWISVFPPDMLRGVYRDDVADQLDLEEPLRWFEELFTGASPAERAVHADIRSYLPYDLLTKVDIASMAVSLECRCPFLDHELVEFAASLPLEWRLGRLGTKHILKDWAADLLPHDILARSKQGFAVPVGQWFREELRDFLQSRVLGSDSLSLRLFRRDRLEELIAEHQSKRANHEHRLWALLMLELWAERWSPTFG
jgi:asparagine synthase (glutamine-hydrolysing)